MNALSHVSVGVIDVEQSMKLYTPLLATLGLTEQKRVEVGGKIVAVGYGRYYPEFWIGLPDNGKPATVGNGVHVALTAKSQEIVKEFHRVALANGATDAGAPGPRPQYHAGYFAAFVTDSLGNKLEAAYVDMGIWNYCAIQ